MKSHAAVVMEPGAPYTIQEIDLPAPRPSEVAVRITAAGICHTDDLVRRGGLYRTPFPIVLGHEGAGQVESVGSSVTRVKPGDQVIVSFRSCGACDECLDGAVAYCRHTLRLNYGSENNMANRNSFLSDGSPVFTGFFGQSSFAEYAVVEERSVIPVEVGADLVWLGPLACSVQAGAGAVMNIARPQPGDSVVVSGVGAVGISALLAAKAMGASPVIAVDVNQQRLDIAASFGANHVLDAADESLARTIRGLTGGGAHIGIDCTGVPAVLPQLVRLTRSRGLTVMVGAVPPKSPIPFDTSHLLAGRTVRGTTAGDSNPALFIPRLIGMWKAGKLPMERFAHTFPFTDLEAATTALSSGDVVKPIVKF